MHTVLVTGGAGFIGSHTVDILVGKGFDVKVLDNLEPQVHVRKPDYLNPKVEYVYGNITDKNQWLKVLKDVNSVVHLAALSGVGQSMYQPVRYLYNNSVGTANMYEVILENPDIKKNIKTMVVASSKVVYGEGAYRCKTHGIVYPHPRSVEQMKRKDWEVHCPFCDDYVTSVAMSEDKPVQNLNQYAISKYDTERLAVNFGNVLEIPTTVFRYFNVYGPRQSLNNPYTGVVAIFISRIKNNNSPIIFEDGDQTRDFIYVEDIANMNVTAVEKSKRTDVYNLGSGSPTSIKQIADILIKLLGSSVEPKTTQEFRPSDNRHDFADISKVKKEFDFKQRWKFEDGFKKLIEWSETQEAIDKFEQAEKERLKFLK